MCYLLLVDKKAEYAPGQDMLRNFKVAGEVQWRTARQALGGMMAKHTVSVYDMIRDAGPDMPIEKWDEKITDHINYLILLKALVVEEKLKLEKEGQN